MGVVTDFAISQRKQRNQGWNFGCPLAEKAPWPLTVPAWSREIVNELI
jgi:hypothetical protein